MIDHAPAGDCPCVTRLHRFGRFLIDLLEAVEHLKAHDIHLFSLAQRIDTSSAAGDLVYHVLGAVVHFERRLISEPTRDGIADARKRGRRPGRFALERETDRLRWSLLRLG